jgi:hypothetical protein
LIAFSRVLARGGLQKEVDIRHGMTREKKRAGNAGV